MKTLMFPEMSFEETYNGERITGLQEFNGKILVFTAHHMYVARKPRWYEKIWQWMAGLRMVVARNLTNSRKADTL